MEKTKARGAPAGIEILRYFYALTVLLSGIHLFFFLPHTEILWLERALSGENSLFAALILIVVPLLLYFGFKYPNLIFWSIAFVYHIFFTINSFLGVIFSLWDNFPVRPLIRITGKQALSLPLSSDTALRLFTVFNLNLFVGIIILWYLWRQRGYFKKTC